MIGIILPVIVENITTRKDNTIKLTLGSQEMSPATAGELFRLLNKFAICYISPKESVDQKEIDQIDKLDPEFNDKTPSQRLRAVLFRFWEQNPEGYKDFKLYYLWKMELIIEHYKSKLEP